MKSVKFLRLVLFMAGLALAMASCQYDEDPGPLQELEQDYAMSGFDRLEMGDALHVTVEQGTEYAVHVKGDRRNLEDLVVRRSGNTLEMKYKNGWRWLRHRNYETHVTIVMPSLLSVRFSGAATTSVYGFETDDFHLSLSGAATCNLNIMAGHSDFDLSGASTLNVTGSASTMRATLSGASMLSGFEYAIEEADIDASGASDVRVNAAQYLKVNVSGASDVVYRGSPTLAISTSGASRVQPE